MKRKIPLGVALAAFLVAGATGPSLSQIRFTPEEALGLAVIAAGGGTSGLATIETRLLKGNPAQPGLYTISIKVPPNTQIAAHTHRDERTAVVVSGIWHFGYARVADKAATRALPPGSFYTEPAGDPHFAWTGREGATVYITGIGPTDTHYVSEIDNPAHR
jgi:uncharacterized RmlC-like cupin family protein